MDCLLSCGGDLSAEQEGAMVPCMEEFMLNSSRHNGYMEWRNVATWPKSNKKWTVQFWNHI